MRRLVHALSLSTLFFAVCTAYLARELYLERAADAVALAQSPSAAPAATAASPGQSTSSPIEVAVSAERPANSVASTSAKSAAPATAATQPRQYEAATTVVSQASPDPAKILAQLEDPAQRAAMVEERKNMYRTIYSDLGEYLHMDEAQFERFLDLKARQELALQEFGTRCYIENSCEAPANRELMKAQKREMADQFGAETMEGYERYVRTSSDRRTVSELRGRLPDKFRLLDSQSDALVNAFHEERQRIQNDSRQRGVQLSSFNNVLYTPEPGTLPDDSTAQAAEEYNRRLRDRAATVLTPEQLAAFEKMQQEASQHFRAMEAQTLRMNASSQKN